MVFMMIKSNGIPSYIVVILSPALGTFGESIVL